MDQQPETNEQISIEQPAEAQVVERQPVLNRNEVLFLFLACMVLGFIGVLSGFVPLVAVAMLGPIVLAFLA